MRGFSLIEAMVAVAIVGIIAALAVPAMLPEVHKATLEGGADNVAGFLARARAEAMTSKRCVRVWVPSTATSTMVAERLNNFDCDIAPATLPGAGGIGLDGSTNVWLEFARLRLDSKRLSIAFTQVPSSSSSGSLAPGSTIAAPFTGDEIRFRPSGRVFSNDNGAMPGRLRNDDAVVTLTHADIVGSLKDKRVLVDGVGLLCVFQAGTNPPVDVANGGGSNLKCP